MKITALLTFILTLQISASTYSQNTRFTLDVKNKTIKEILKSIESQSNFRFFYNDGFSELNSTIDIQITDMRLDDILNKMVAGTDLTFKVLENNLIVITPKSMLQQQRVTGTVTDASNGEPLAGVYVRIEGTNAGTITDAEGNYSVEVPGQDAVLLFSFIGYNTENITVAEKTQINVTMIPDISELEEVVVVGYGVQKKKLSTGATSQLKGDDLSRLNTTQTLTSVQGQVPGLQISKNSGQPGANFKINIRGLGTNLDSSPLYVVDGIPTSSIDFLSSSDIESLDVLKDAASAAIYGARAANGVILITTKQGKAGKPTITFDSFYGWQNLYKKLDLLNAQEYAMIVNEAWVTAGNNSLYDPTNPDGFAQTVPDWDKIENGTWKGTDWLEETRVKNALTQNHSLNITGGTEQSVYSVGLSYNQQQGILGKPVESNYQRVTFRVNSDHTLLKKNGLTILKVGENINFSASKNNVLPTGMAYYNFLTRFIQMHPFLPVYDDDGNYHFAIPWSTSDVHVNPIGYTDYSFGQNVIKSQKIIGSLYADIQLLNGLIWRNSFGIDNGLSNYRSFIPEFYLSTAANGQNPYSKVVQSMSSSMGWIYESTLSYNFKIKEKHNINVLAGTSFQRTGLGEGLTGQNGYSNFNDLDHAYLDNTPVVDPSYTSLNGFPEGKGGIASVFGRLNYNFNETYLFTAVMRADGSSNFAEDNRWGYFPSFSAGWVMSNEQFMQSSRSWLDFLKLRASWGQNGNQNIGAFAYMSTITFSGTGASYFYSSDKGDRTLGAYPLKVANPDLKWETSEQINLGLDSRFFGGRLGLSLDLYRKTTKDWLVDAPALDSYGTGAPTINGGDVRNQGIELSLSWNDNKGDFKYGFSGNISYNQNEVTEVANREGFIESSSTGFGGLQRAMVGYPFGVFWGRKTDGIFQDESEVQAYQNEDGSMIQPDAKPGDFRYVDVNKDGVINDNDRTDIGKSSPDYTMGISAHAEYRGFDFSVMTTGVVGNQNAMLYMMNSSSAFRVFKSNYTTEILNRWHGKGTSNTVPRVAQDATNFAYFSDYFVRDASYLRISNVTLGYDLKKGFRRIPLNQLRLYCSVQNLYTFTKYTGMDPEVGFGNDAASEGSSPSWTSGIDLGFYPSPRTFLIGVNIKF